MGWKTDKKYASTLIGMSQSAFAGYGLEVHNQCRCVKSFKSRNPLSLDMGWKTLWLTHSVFWTKSRNPLSLDMGLKQACYVGASSQQTSQSAFAGYGLEDTNKTYVDGLFQGSQSAFAGYGLEE